MNTRISKPLIVREARFEDQAGADLVLKKVGMRGMCKTFWNLLFLSNPTRLKMPVEYPLGWVVEDDGKIVGFGANLIDMYHFNGQDLVCALGTDTAILPEYRGSIGIRLYSRFTKQKNIDFILVTSANLGSEKMLKFFKFSHIPMQDISMEFYFIVSVGKILEEKLFSKYPKIPYIANAIGETILTPTANLLLKLIKKPPRYLPDKLLYKTITVNEIDASFDELWLKCTKSKKLLAYRTKEYLCWKYSFQPADNPVRLICAYKNEELMGYLTLAEILDDSTNLSAINIIDVFIWNDDSQITSNLLYFAHQYAIKNQYDVLSFSRIPEPAKKVFIDQGGTPYRRQTNFNPVLYITEYPQIKDLFSKQNQLHITRYDGDSSFWDRDVDTN